MVRGIVGAGVLVGALTVAAGAAGKDFRPGDLRVCNGTRCLAIHNQLALDALARFYYDSRTPPVRVTAPRPGVPFFRLEFPNGYVTGIVASSKLDRFLSYGVNLDQFRRGVWYRLPARAAAELRTLTVRLVPLRLNAAALRLSH